MKTETMYTRAYSKLVSWADRRLYMKRIERKQILDYLSEIKPKRVLDFGCNTGFFANMAKDKLGVEVYGADISKDALARGREMFGSVNFVHVDDLKKSGAKFDAITMSHVLEHVPDCEETLSFLKSLLTPNGRLIISVPQERVRGDCNIPHIVLCSLQNRKLTNPHLRIVRKKNLGRMLNNVGMEIESHAYANLIPPFVTKKYFWPIAFSLIVKCKK